MKPLWVHTLFWLAAVVVALLLAFAAPDSQDGLLLPHGATAPR